MVSKWPLLLFFLLVPGLACGAPPERIRSLAGPAICTTEFKDGSNTTTNQIWPANIVSVQNLHSSPIARNCTLTLDQHFVAGLHTPAALFGTIARVRNGHVSVTMNGHLVPIANAAIQLLPLPASGWHGPIELQFSFTDIKGPIPHGDPAMWKIGEYEDVESYFLRRAVPELLHIGFYLMGSLLTAAMLVALRRKKFPLRQAPLLLAFLLSSAVVRIYDNAFLGPWLSYKNDVLFIVRFPLGLILVVLLVELIRRNLQIARTRALDLFYMITAACALARVWMMSGFGYQLLPWTNAPGMLMPILVVAFAVYRLRRSRPGVHDWFPYVVLIFAVAMAGRMSALSGFPLVPDYSAHAYILLSLSLCLKASLTAVEDASFRIRGEAIARYVPIPLREMLLNDQVLTPKTRVCASVLSCTVDNFDILSAPLDPEVVARVLSRYISTMVQIAEGDRSSVVHVSGATLMVFVGAPIHVDEEQGVVTLLDIALRMRSALTDVNREIRMSGVDITLFMRCGFNTGYVTPGEFGSADRFEYTIIGEAVSIASLLERGAAPGEILIGSRTYHLCKAKFACEPRPPVVSRRLSYPIQAWQVLGRDEFASSKDDAHPVLLDASANWLLALSTPRARLHGLLCALFSSDELRRFIALNATGIRLDQHLLGAEADQSAFVFHAIDVLERRKLVDSSFFQRLLLERPRHVREISDVATQWQMQSDVD